MMDRISPEKTWKFRSIFMQKAKKINKQVVSDRFVKEVREDL